MTWLIKSSTFGSFFYHIKSVISEFYTNHAETFQTHISDLQRKPVGPSKCLTLYQQYTCTNLCAIVF